MPTTFQAGDYSATLTYLKAVQAAGTTEADAVMKQLKTLKIDDMFAKSYVRADDTMVHDMYLMPVQPPAESTNHWDYYKTEIGRAHVRPPVTHAQLVCRLLLTKKNKNNTTR